MQVMDNGNDKWIFIGDFMAGCLQKTNRALPVAETEKGSSTDEHRNRNPNTAHY
jgi:hypothetical protein